MAWSSAVSIHHMELSLVLKQTNESKAHSIEQHNANRVARGDDRFPLHHIERTLEGLMQVCTTLSRRDRAHRLRSIDAEQDSVARQGQELAWFDGRHRNVEPRLQRYGSIFSFVAIPYHLRDLPPLLELSIRYWYSCSLRVKRRHRTRRSGWEENVTRVKRCCSLLRGP